MSSQMPVACKDCEREGLRLRDCRIRIINFSVFNRKCPRELASVPVVTEAAKEAPAVEIPRQPSPPPSQEISSAAVEKVISVTSDNIMVSNIPIDRLELGAFSPRMQFDPNHIAKLAEDIEAEGQLKPIMVRPHPMDPNKYQVIDGEHRIRALQKLGKTLARAEVHVLSDEEAYYRAMRINQQHGKPLEELEEACHINKMISIFNLSQEEVGKRFNRSREWVSKRLDLALRLAPKVEEYYVGSRLPSSSHAIEIAQLSKEDQEKVVEKVVEKRLPRRATRALVYAIKKASPEQKQQILQKPIDFYAKEFKDSKQMEKALLTIKPEDDFLRRAEEIKTEEEARKFWATSKPDEAVASFQCPGCGRKLRVDWAKGEVLWD